MAEFEFEIWSRVLHAKQEAHDEGTLPSALC